MASGVLFAELHVLSGERQESSDLVGVATSPFLSLFKRRRGQLFTIVEPSFLDTEGLGHKLIETIEDEYFRDSSRSVTSGLRHAITVAGERLRNENSRAQPDRQMRIGLTCAAVRDGDVYVAQLAPGTAFIVHEGTVKRVFSAYPVTPDPLSEGFDAVSSESAARPEGQITLGFSPLSEGDLIVLASGAYWKMIPDRYIIDAAKHVDPDMAAEELYNGYLAHTRRPTTSIVVIKVAQLPGRRKAVERTEEPQAREPAKPEPRDGVAGGRESYSRGYSSGSSSRSDPRVVPGLRGEGKEGFRDPFKVSRDPFALETPAKNPWLQPRGQSDDTGEPQPFWNKLLSRFRGNQNKEPLYPPGPALEPVGKSLVHLKPGWGPRVDRSGWPAWVGKVVPTLLLAALLVMIGTVGINFWRSWQLGDPVALAQEAQQKQAAASSAPDQTASRALLVQSEELYEKSLRAKEDASVRGAATAVQDAIDKIDSTVRVTQATVMVDYSSVVEDKGDVTQLAIDSNNLYVMDEGLDRLYKYIINADGKGVQEPNNHLVLVRRGDKLDGAVVGDLLSLTWMPAGQLRSSPALFALESGRALVSYDPKNGLSRIEVADSAKWGTIQSINGFAGGLYLLDTKLKGVFYYPPTKNGYESEPYTIVDSRAKVDLAKAVDIALDGSLYVLESAGTIKRFNREGRALDFAGDLPDGPIKGPKALFASANTRSLYVLDTVGERVLQFSPEGKLQRQFKAGGKDVSFKELRDIFVDEGARKMYLLARKSLFVIDLPSMQ